jgi:hypothetical protein
MHGRDEKYINNLSFKTYRKGTAERPSRRWEDHITVDLEGIGW